MYDSLTLTVLSNIYNGIKRGYEYSLFKKVLIKISKVFKYLSRGSWFVRFFTSDRKILEESLFYKLYCKFLDNVYKFIKYFNKAANRWKENSIIYIIISRLFKDKRKTQDTFHIFLMFFGLTLLFLNIFKGQILTKTNILSIFIVLISLLGIKNGYEEGIKESLILKFIKGFVSIDEGGRK